MGAFVGRDVVVEFSIADEANKPATSAYKVLGMMRDKNISASWDTADTTADKSPDFTRTSLVTFKQVTFSGGGVSYTEDAFNQDAFEKHVIEPPAATGHQPKVWLRVTYPSGKIYEGPFIVNQFDSAAPYADAATWKINAQSNGAVTLTLPTAP